MTERDQQRLPSAVDVAHQHARSASGLTPIADILPSVLADILERCEAYHASHRESA